MVFNRYQKQKRRNTGYYLAALICAVAVGVVVWTNLDSKKTPKPSEPSPTDMDTAQEKLLSEMFDDSEYLYDDGSAEPMESSDSDIPALPVEDSEPEDVPEPVPVDAPEPEEDDDEEETVEAAARPTLFMNPVKGSVQKDFSGDSLVYCKTMDDWRVHNGVDISCEDDSVISAVAAGTVSSAAKDDRYGNVVIVRHPDGSMAYYCGLEDMSVRDGEEIKAGQKLGIVGSIPCECEEGAHLHLMFMRDGEFTDPMKALSLDY